MKAGSYDCIEMSGQPADWRDILDVFAVKIAGADDGVDVATFNTDRMIRLRAVYWDMTTITSWVETIDHDGSDLDDDVDDSWREYILHIAVTGQMGVKAACTDQRAQLVELQAPENNDLWLALLYGVSAMDNEIVAVDLSQLGNMGGELYGSGMVIPTMWTGAPALSPGAPTSVVIWIAESSPGFQAAPWEANGSRTGTSGRTEAWNRFLVCSYSLTGTGTMDRMVARIM